MKALFLALLALTVLSTPSFASSKSETVRIFESVSAGTTHLSPGDYKVTYEGNGPKVSVTLSRNPKEHVTLDADLVTKENNPTGVLVENSNGATVLHEIRLKHVSLVIPESAATKD